MLFTSWSIASPDPSLQQELSSALGVHPITAQIMINRGVECAEDGRVHLMPALKSLPDPFLLPDMSVAVDRIARAIRDKENIAIYGDYDVDGITSSALMVCFFRMLGVDVRVYIPNRLREGYGLSVDAINKLKEQGIDLVITVDNGTRSVSEVGIAKDLGLDVVVTDHHEVEGPLPEAIAVVNPKRPESEYPHRDLAGCGVAFALTMALRKKLRDEGLLPDPEPNLKDYLDLVAIGTIADIVPLVGVNRTLTKFGINRMMENPRPGVKSLLKVGGLDPARGLSSGQIAFRIAPRINAAGRMGEAYPALECLIADDQGQADALTGELDRANAERQRVEERILNEALKDDGFKMAEKGHAVVVASPRWHPGVVGIVASKLAETTKKPSAVIACSGGIGKGSVRTSAGVNVMGALSRAADMLDRFGGHEQAAGFTIDVRRIDEFRERFSSACAEFASQKEGPVLSVDAEVDASNIDDRLVYEISQLGPYGTGNPEPVLCCGDLKVEDASIVGSNHLRLKVSDGRTYFSAIGFGMADLIPDLKSDSLIAFVPQHNEWNGNVSIQLKIKGILAK
jgi:single-stranded-DNA-specific exonuclease